MKYWKLLIIILFMSISTVGCANNTGDTPAVVLETAVTLNHPTGMAADSSNNLYIVDSGNDRIVKLTPTGELIATWGRHGSGEGEFNFTLDKGTLCGIAVDANDHIFVVDKGNYRIQKFDSSGRFLTSWGSKGTGEGQFVRAIYVAVDPAGNVYVTDDRNPVVQKFDGDGRFLTSWGSLGGGDGQFRHATGVAVDDDGFVYVSDYDNRRVQQFDGDGSFISSWQTIVNGKAGIPEAIAITPNGHIAITDSRHKQLLIVNSDGTLQSAMPIPGGSLFNKLLPYGIAVDSEGMITVSSRNQNQIIQYKPNNLD